MSLAMPDSIIPANLPTGYGQYLGYVDGNPVTVHELSDRFPGAHIVGLTVTAATLDADGIDCEPGNPDAASAARWAADKLTIAPSFRPVIYASILGSPRYGMPDVISELDLLGIAPSRVRLLSAHYGVGQHICGPITCRASGLPMDGTQWTDQFQGVGGKLVDMSALRDDFFGGQVPPQPPQTGWTEKIVQQLPTVQQGNTGEGVRTVQGACNARHQPTAIDGIFGPDTHNSVYLIQQHAGITADGIVGQQTWPVLLGVA